MKKIYSWFMVVCLITALLPVSISAADADPGTIEGWTVSGDGSAELVSDTVGKGSKPVIKWNRTAGGETTLSYVTDNLEEGRYEISVTAKMPGDHGTAVFGIAGDMSGGLQNNTNEYSVTTTDVTVTGKQQTLQLSLSGGSSTVGYISEVTMRKKDGEVSYGENLVLNGDFEKEVENTEPGTMSGWTLDSYSNAVITEAEVDEKIKPVVKWQYSATKGQHRALKYYIGDVPAGEYKVSFYAYIPGNPGGSNYGLTCEGLSPVGINIGRWNDGYLLVEKTITISADKSNQYFQIITDGYGDTNYLYLSEASVCPVNSDGTLGKNLIENYNFVNESDTIKVPDTEGWASSYEATPIGGGTGTYDGVTKSTLTWTHADNGAQLKKHVKLYYSMGAVEAGTYKYEAVLKHTNVGDGRITVAASNVVQPGSSYTALAGSGSGGEFIKVNGTVTFESPVADAQFIVFTNGYGDTGTMHLYSVSVRKVNANYEYGENVIENSDFKTLEYYSYNEDFEKMNTGIVPEGWISDHGDGVTVPGIGAQVVERDGNKSMRIIDLNASRGALSVYKTYEPDEGVSVSFDYKMIQSGFNGTSCVGSNGMGIVNGGTLTAFFRVFEDAKGIGNLRYYYNKNWTDTPVVNLKADEWYNFKLETAKGSSDVKVTVSGYEPFEMPLNASSSVTDRVKFTSGSAEGCNDDFLVDNVTIRTGIVSDEEPEAPSEDNDATVPDVIVAQAAAPDYLYFPDIANIPAEIYNGKYPNGKLLVSYYRNIIHDPNTKEEMMGSTIELTESVDDGKTWSKGKVIIDQDKLIEWGLSTDSIPTEARDPNLALLNDGTLLLTFYTAHPSETKYGRTYLMESKDGGDTWGEPVLIPCSSVDESYAKRGDIAVFDDDYILIPLYGVPTTDKGNCIAFCVPAYRDENGKWVFDLEKESIIGNKTFEENMTVCEPSIVATGKNTAYAMIREPGKVYRTDDRGVTWTLVGDEPGKIHQPGLKLLDDGSIFVTWAVQNEYGRPVYGKRFYPDCGWDATETQLIYRSPNNEGDMGDPSNSLTNDGRILVVYYDKSTRYIGATFCELDEFEIPELNSDYTRCIIADDVSFFEGDGVSDGNGVIEFKDNSVMESKENISDNFTVTCEMKVEGNSGNVFCFEYGDELYAEFDSLVPGTEYCVKFVRIGNSVKAKIWEKGETEPDEWYAEYTAQNTVNTDKFSIGYKSFDGGAGYVGNIVISRAMKIELPERKEMLEVSEPAKLECNVFPPLSGNNEINWVSSDTDVAEILNDGIIKPKSAGITTITATIGDMTAECEVTVKAIPYEASMKDSPKPVKFWDFENYDVGEFTDKSDFSQYIGTSDSLTVKENNDGKYLELVNDWGTGRTTTQLISNSVYSGNYSISFDFSFEASSDTTQEMYINPAHGGSNYLIHLQENGLIIKAATSSDPIVQIPKAHIPGEWFTARVTKADGYLFVKTWIKGEAEPSDWDLSYYNDNNKKNGVIRLAWYGDHKVVLDMDNLAISRRQDINRIDITKDNVSVSVEDSTDSAVLVLASYKEDKLVDTKIVDVTGDMNVSLTEVELSYDIGNEIRAFLWKDLQNMEPVCDPDSYVVKKETTYGENLISNYNFTDSDGNGTLDGWSLYCDDEYVLQNGMSMELSKPMLNGISKPVLKWNYLIGNQGHIRYIDYKLGKLEPGDYLVSVTVSVPDNPGYTAYGLTGSIETDKGYELGRFTKAYKTFAKTVTVTEDQKDVEQSFRISSNGYGDTGSLYVWEASVKKINN